MRKINITFALAASLLLMGCQNEADVNGKGSVTISVAQSTAFTRAVDMSALTNTANYTVDIYDANGVCAFSEKLGAMTDRTIELEEGAYRLVAHCGEEKTASQNDLCLRGETAFNVKVGESTDVSVTCVPTAARVSVSFGENMDKAFSDYYVSFSTKALREEGKTAVWTKQDSDPWYLTVDPEETVVAEIHVTRITDGKSAVITREHALSVAKAWTLGIDAEENQLPEGTSVISITIDESTNDVNETIVVPDNWWM